MFNVLKNCLLTIAVASLSGIGYGATEQLNGIASYHHDGQEAFIAAILTEQPTDDAALLLNAEVAKTAEVHLVRDIQRANWVALWQTCSAANNPQALIDKTTPALTSMFATIKGDLKTGDNMRATYRPGEGTALILNDTRLGDIYPNKDIFNLLANCLVGRAAPSPEFLAQILGRSRNPALIQRYIALQPTSQRKQEVAAWKFDNAASSVSADSAPAESTDSPQMAAYAEEILKKVYASTRYPGSAIRRGQEGSVTLTLTVNRDGSLASTEVTQSAPHPALNRAARAAAIKASPFATFTQDMDFDSATFTIPIEFKLQTN